VFYWFRNSLNSFFAFFSPSINWLFRVFGYQAKTVKARSCHPQSLPAPLASGQRGDFNGQRANDLLVAEIKPLLIILPAILGFTVRNLQIVVQYTLL
jgi:hypothetical protein